MVSRTDFITASAAERFTSLQMTGKIGSSVQRSIWDSDLVASLASKEQTLCQFITTMFITAANASLCIFYYLALYWGNNYVILLTTVLADMLEVYLL